MNTKYTIAQEFYDEVCQRAERNMAITHKLEGAHYAAMQSILKEWKESPTQVCQLIPLDSLGEGNFVHCADDCECN